MKKLLLLAGAALVAASASAQALQLQRAEAAPVAVQSAQVKAMPKTNQAQVTKAGVIKTTTLPNGMKLKTIDLNRKSVPALKSKAAPSRSANVMSETFEGWDGVTENWLPDGWQDVCMDDAELNPWYVDYYPNYWMYDGEGDYAAMIAYTTEYSNEWLISPEFTVEEGNQLQFLANADLVWMLDMSYVDWDTYEYTEQVPAAYLQVWAKATDSEEWVLLKNFLDDAIGVSFWDLLMEAENTFGKHTLPLDDFVGKTIQIAFQYVGTDGNTTAIDDVRVCMPALEADYQFPLYKQFFGVGTSYTGLSSSIPVMPQYTPLTWINCSDNDLEVEYTWEYTDADDNEAVSNDEDLTVTYHPDYSSDFTTRNCCYYSPVLNVNAEGWSTGSYTVYDFFQVGGKAEWESSGTLLNLGMSAFDPANDGYTWFEADNGAPIFGWNEDVDAFWTDYTFGGDNGDDDWVKLTKIMNVYVAPPSPLVFSKAWTHAYIQDLNADAEFTLEVVPLVYDEEEWGYVLGEPIATAVCKAEDVFLGIEGTSYYVLPFDFGEDVTISDEDMDQYVIMLGGFNGCAEYFGPMQGWNEPLDGMNHGWVMKEISFAGDVRTSLSAMANYTGVMQSFGIMLDACYPYLKAETDKVNVSPDAPVEVALDSYYDASELTVEGTSDGISVELSGRYGESKAVITSVTTAEIVDNIVIKGAGVEATIEVANGTSGISTINVSEEAPVEYYNLQGIRIDNPADGSIVIKKQGSTVTKVAK